MDTLSFFTIFDYEIISFEREIAVVADFSIAKLSLGGLAKRAHPARARYLNVNLARRNKDLQPGGTEIESLEEKSDSL